MTDGNLKELKESIHGLLTGLYKNGEFNGNALVALDSGIIYKKSFGCADWAWRVPNKPDTRFMLGSNTKQFTSMLVLQLVEKGILLLDRPISNYLTNIRSDLGSVITIRHLLTHSSGIPDLFHELSSEADGYFIPHTPGLVNSHVSNERLEFTPGAGFKYCNTGYCLLGNIIEECTGKTYPEMLLENILLPLGMHNTGFFDGDGSPVEFARSYSYAEKGLRPEQVPDRRATYSSGNIYSTTGDLYLWDRALYTGGLLSGGYRDMMFTPHLSNYAFGWVSAHVGAGRINEFMLDPLGYSSPAEDGDYTFMVHRGRTAGFTSFILRIAEKGLLVVLLNNIITPVFPEEIACGLLDLLKNHCIL